MKNVEASPAPVPDRPQKLHRHLVQAVVVALEDIFMDGYHADKTIERQLKGNPKWGARDRSFFAESVYECVRWMRLLAEVAESEDFWQVFGTYWILKKHGELPSWEEFDGLDPVILAKRRKKIESSSRALRESIPDWMDELGDQELGAEWPECLKALNQPASVVLRVNRNKINRADLQKKLIEEEIHTVIDERLVDGLVLRERKNVFRSKSFQSGDFEVQDGASQWVVPLLNPKPGERVIDACAGAGGKTLHIASLMGNRGKIIALDVHDKKLAQAKIRLRRADVQIAEVRMIDSSKVIKRLEKSADALLLDVPCSGIGVLRRNPDSKWKLDLEELGRLKLLQREILADYSKMVKAGGRMVYATCSILPSENHQQVQWFLNESEAGKSWQLVEEKFFRPDRDGFDGFYAAHLVKK
ncbi:MAG: RsmB/NOP family class I SAM-dependent RNA methyltransferase [Bdellovibrionales bacterium]|nr:RsmB/NOP family class I SAM-dependent RNA methyltransferase [Bdellovibrionales bacterium]